MKDLFLKVSVIEGISLLMLLGIAMPIKYIYGDPLWVRIVGMVHGILFILFVMVLAQFARENKYPISKVILLLMFSSLPFGFFAIERSVSK